MTRKLLFLLLLCTLPVGAQPLTPTVYLNEKVRLCELAVGQRATLRFDLRPISAQHLKILLYRHDQKTDEVPVREWLIHRAAGQERLSFADLPRDVYTLTAMACDVDGNALALPAPYVHVEYGGRRAWEKFQPSVEVVKEQPAAFTDLDVATKLSNREAQIAIDPPAVVVRPGGEVSLRAGFKGMEPERLKWSVVGGSGKLTSVDNYHYTFHAPAGQVGSKLIRVEIQSEAHPDLVGGSMILITDADPDSLNETTGP